MTTAIGYTRVSTDQQADHGVSLEAQAAKIQTAAADRGVELLDVIRDGGASGKNLNRPGMSRLLILVDQRKVSMVIIASRDRLTRSARDLEDLIERFGHRRVSLVSVGDPIDTSTANGRMEAWIMVAVSQHQREYIGERTRAALQYKKSQGQRVGTIPFGSSLGEDGCHLIPNPAERQIVAHIQDCRAAGYSLRSIADELNRQGYQTRRGGAWRHTYVRNILAAAA